MDNGRKDVNSKGQQMTLKYNEHGRPYEDLTDENKKLNSRIKELENSLSIALEINDTYQRERKNSQDHIEQVKKEADQLMINKIIKYENQINELKKDLARAKEDHQYDNLVHQKELKELNKK